MSELRHDPIQRRWIIVAPERGLRPIEQRNGVVESDPAPCPFCPGNEHMTPPEIFALRGPGQPANGPGWQVRVIPNKYPALSVDEHLRRSARGIYDVTSGVGAHEVIIETPDHQQPLIAFERAHLAQVLAVYRNRVADLMRDPRLRYVLVFKNAGAAAAASLQHSHAQLIATPITPRTAALELDSAKDYYRNKERCLFCDIIAQELDAARRVVVENDAFLAVCPFASRFAYEMMIFPKQHQHCITKAQDSDLFSLAEVLQEALRRLSRRVHNVAYNFVLHTAPNTETNPRRPGYWGTLAYDFHWHIEVIPRISEVAGFEWGTGFYINPVAPEEAARDLREANG